MDFMIRKAFVSDLNDICALERRFNADGYPRWMLKKLIKSKSNLFLVADNMDIIGYAIVSFRKNSRKTRLYSIVVSEKCEGHGVAKKLIEKCEKDMIKLSKTSMHLEVSIENKRAISLYTHLGFEIKKTIKTYYQSGDDAYVMEKDLCGGNGVAALHG
jgi:[ribosomal protein S18]-alanine N-acetyltransferase